MKRIGESLDAELFGGPVPVPIAAPQAVPDDAAVVKAMVVLRALQAAGLKAPFDFNLEEAKLLWAARLGRFSLDVLTAAVNDWIGSPGTDFPSVGDIESGATFVVVERDREEHVPRSTDPCPECNDVRFVTIRQMTKIFDTFRNEEREVEDRFTRPCERCLPERYDLWRRGHFDADHVGRGGCPKCWDYLPSLRHKAKAARAK